MGEKGAVLETSDGGANWRTVKLDLDQDIDALTVSQGAAWFTALGTIALSEAQERD